MEANGHIGVVTRAEGAKAVVHFERSAQCAHCGACLAAGDKEMEITLDNALGAKVGDRVRVSLAAKRVVQASLIAYAIPLGLLLVGVGLGSLVSDTVGLFSGIGGCALSFCVLKWIDRRNAKKNTYTPRITKILSNND